ncbi:VOC family protein [Actinoplanes sp. DH11]|uniref:VOC family protein n=1 Tax=Actinoplanes sp. DH11 TaxID=2857011 RepID=UPI001E5B0D84|nr:VOC family protein [Actinoplanes sp. DH11]
MTGGLHHVELWVPDVAGAAGPWGWLLGELGWVEFQEWPAGRSWRHDGVYLVLEQSPALSGPVHDRTAPGLNHLAFTVPDTAEVDRLWAAAPGHGWTHLFADRYPHAGGPDNYAAHLSDPWGYEAELTTP